MNAATSWICFGVRLPLKDGIVPMLPRFPFVTVFVILA